MRTVQVRNLSLDFRGDSLSQRWTPRLSMDDPALCAGHVVARLLGDVIGKSIRRILEPIDTILGPSSFLMTEIQATQVLSKNEFFFFVF